MTAIDLLRHGEAAPGLCLGSASDPPLTEAGWAQMAAALAGGGWDGVVCSPSRRCAEFAAGLGLPLRQDGRFRELGFGGWEGRPWAELYQEAGGPLLAFQRDPSACANPAPGGEPFGDFERRVGGAWDDLLSAAAGRRWLLVAHAGVLRAVLRRVLGFPAARGFAIRVPPACLIRIERRDGEPARLCAIGSAGA
jgi:broad specificity phosphatase PhoE